MLRSLRALRVYSASMLLQALTTAASMTWSRQSRRTHNKPTRSNPGSESGWISGAVTRSLRMPYRSEETQHDLDESHALRYSTLNSAFWSRSVCLFLRWTKDSDFRLLGRRRRDRNRLQRSGPSGSPFGIRPLRCSVWLEGQSVLTHSGIDRLCCITCFLGLDSPVWHRRSVLCDFEAVKS